MDTWFLIRIVLGIVGMIYGFGITIYAYENADTVGLDYSTLLVLMGSISAMGGGSIFAYTLYSGLP